MQTPDSYASRAVITKTKQQQPQLQAESASGKRAASIFFNLRGKEGPASPKIASLCYSRWRRGRGASPEPAAQESRGGAVEQAEGWPAGSHRPPARGRMPHLGRKLYWIMCTVARSKHAFRTTLHVILVSYCIVCDLCVTPLTAVWTSV